MKKLKKSTDSKDKSKSQLFELDTKCSRVTIDSRICNIDKFNLFYAIIDNAKEFKNIVSNHCFNHLNLISSNYPEFLKQYNQFDSNQLNAWERQAIFQEIAGHYSETITRYLNKAKFIVNKPNPKSNINNIAKIIYSNSFINHENNLVFNIEEKLTQLNQYLTQYQSELDLTKYKMNTDELDKEISKLERLIKSYTKLISNYNEIQLLKVNKPLLYNRVINLIQSKKIRLLSYVKLAKYQTGTHARNLDNAQISIVEDKSNDKYQYFLKVRLNDTLIGREPKLTEKNKDSFDSLLAKFKQDNFIYLPITFNKGKLKDINKSLDSILSSDNPQILIKSEQLRLNSKSRKIHIIFNYKSNNELGSIIESTLLEKKDISLLNPTDKNTIGLDVNLKHNLLADSNGHIYNELLMNKSKFLDNLNEIVTLQAIPTSDRTIKQKYRYEKLLRVNESLLKAYLSTLIKDWKSKNILHLVLEDLNIINDKSYYQHGSVKIKYSRLVRLIRLNNIKTWISQMSEKQGIFTHLVNPAYTSQECSVCHFISNSNRTKQEEFKCTNPKCKHKENADYNSAKNIKSRLLNKNLRKQLGNDNVYSCSRTKFIFYKQVKIILETEYEIKPKTGVVTELLSVYKLKEASSFRAR